MTLLFVRCLHCALSVSVLPFCGLCCNEQIRTAVPAPNVGEPNLSSES